MTRKEQWEKAKEDFRREIKNLKAKPTVSLSPSDTIKQMREQVETMLNEVRETQKERDLTADELEQMDALESAADQLGQENLTDDDIELIGEAFTAIVKDRPFLSATDELALDVFEGTMKGEWQPETSEEEIKKDVKDVKEEAKDLDEGKLKMMKKKRLKD